jgi:hypothetical protein
MHTTNLELTRKVETLTSEVESLRTGESGAASHPGPIERQSWAQRQDNIDTLMRDTKQLHGAARRVLVTLQEQLNWAKRNGDVGSLEGVVAQLQARKCRR